MRRRAKCPNINLSDQETDDQYSDTSESIRFHIYHLIARFTTHGRLPLNDKKSFRKCRQDSASENPQKYKLKKS